MRSGTLRTPIELLSQREVGRTESGESRTSVESIGDIWCRISAVGGQRSEVAARLAPKATHAVAVRYDSRIHSGMGLRLRDGRVLIVESILDHRDKRGDPGDPKIDLELLCSEGELLA